MRKSLVLFIFAALAVIVQAQADDRTLTIGEYWVDDDHAGRASVAIGSGGLWQFTFDGATLSEGLHALRYRAQDSDGNYSPVQSWLFYRYVKDTAGASTLEYWIDDAEETVTLTVSDTETVFAVDASSVAEGLHTLHYRLNTPTGQMGAERTWLFYRTAPAYKGGARTMEYWLDEAEEHQTVAADATDMSDLSFVVDASALDEGLHTLHYYIREEGGHISTQQSWLFYRTAPVYNGGARTMEYWLDEAEEHQTVAADATDVAFVLDASALDEGLHTLHYCIREEGGRISAQQLWQFYRVSPQVAGSSISWYRIWWNDHTDQAVTVALDDGHREVLYEEVLAVPEYARNDGYTRNYTARFYIVFGDDRDNLSPVTTATVAYPDIYPPNTTLKARISGWDVTLDWEADEDYVKDYNVYYSENGEPYVLWKANTTSQTATFRGQRGSSYRFLVTARDVNGNYEAIEPGKAVSVSLDN